MDPLYTQPPGMGSSRDGLASAGQEAAGLRNADLRNAKCKISKAKWSDPNRTGLVRSPDHFALLILHFAFCIPKVRLLPYLGTGAVGTGLGAGAVGAVGVVPGGGKRSARRMVTVFSRYFR